MSVDFNETSGNVIDPRASYNPEKLANEVIWPLVNFVWTQGTGTEDWRVDAVAEEDMINIFRRGRYKGKNLRVELAASVDAEEEEDDDDESFPFDFNDDDEDDDEGFEIPYQDTIVGDEEDGPVSRATFYLNEVVMGPTRLAIIDMARLTLHAKAEATPEHTEQMLLDWPTGDEALFKVATERTYTFCGDGYWSYRHAVIINGTNMDRMSLPFESADEVVEDDKIRLADIEAFQAICAVFNAPKAIKQALGRIKAQPILPTK